MTPETDPEWERELQEQLDEDAYNDWLLEQRERESERTEDVLFEWMAYDTEAVSSEMWGARRRAVRRFVQLLPLGTILEALDIAQSKHWITNEERRLRYFCGICSNRVEENAERARRDLET